MALRRLFIFIVIAAATVAATLAQTSVEISLPRNARVGQRFTIAVTVNNPEGNIQTPKNPSLSGCTFAGGPGTSSSSSISIINGRMQRSETKSYTFTYVADEEGTVKVPAVTVTVNGKQYSTQPGQFTVSAGQSSQQGGGASASAGRGASGGNFEIGPDELFMRVVVSQSSVYEQQAVEASIKLYSSNQQVEGLSTSALPTFDGCLIESLGMPQNIEWRSETVGGRQMYSAVVYRALLYPQRAGTITLNGGEYTARAYRQTYVQDFFGYRPSMESRDVKLKPHSTTLTVRALPSPKPAGFSGAVGKFRASSKLVGNTFKTNDAASIIYTIEGTGNIKFLNVPPVDFPSEFEVYEPAVENSARASGANMTGTETIEYTFVPQSVGKFTIGGFDFIYFDPSSAEYVTIPVDGYEIDVKKGANVSSTAVGGKQDIKAKNTDIHHIRPNADAIGPKGGFMSQSTLYWALYPLLLAVAGVIMVVFWRRRSADPEARKLRQAGKVARRRLTKAGKFLRAKNLEGFYAELLRAMQSYLSDKLALPASQLSRDSISEALARRGASPELISNLHSLLNDCEMARYTPQTSGAADQSFDAAREIINSIEDLK